MNDDNQSNGKPPRRRGLTSLTLQWLSEKLRRTDKIKQELSSGTYQVDSAKVAQAMIGTPQSSQDDAQR
jgi:anti-sigma28 factor (negative regulator of flagellin synthesis)